MPGAPRPLPDAFRDVGGAIARRVARVTGSADDAQRAAEELFVRLVTSARGTGDARVREAWIFRVATAWSLKRLPEEARPGGPAPGPPAAGPLPPMRALRALDEAAWNAVVLARLDGLSPDEIAEVLGLDAALVRRKLREADARLGAAPAGARGPHPSLLAMERERDAALAHAADCAACRDALAELDAAARTFDARVTPEVVARVGRALRDERNRLAPGPGWRRVLWMTGAFIVITVLAFVVARPREVKPEQLPFRGPVTAARLKAAGLEITVHRDDEVVALAPGALSRLGDRFHFKVRAEGPRFLELVAEGPGGEARIFPVGGQMAAPVKPRQTLDQDYVVAAPLAVPGKALWIVGRFAEHPFPLGARDVPGIETVPVRVDLEP